MIGFNTRVTLVIRPWSFKDFIAQNRVQIVKAHGICFLVIWRAGPLWGAKNVKLLSWVILKTKLLPMKWFVKVIFYLPCDRLWV